MGALVFDEETLTLRGAAWYPGTFNAYLVATDSHGDEYMYPWDPTREEYNRAEAWFSIIVADGVYHN